MAQVALELPTQRTAAHLSPTDVKGLIYGPPKVGKSTFLAEFDPEHTLFIACEPGLGGLDVFQQPCSSWQEFRQIGTALAAGKHEFRTVVVDTVDELARFCTDDVVDKLGIAHPSDAEYGKGWAAVNDEFRLRVARLASLGLGVWFVSHATDKTVKQRIGEKTVTVPSLGGKTRDFITGFVDVILYAEIEQTENGQRRVIRTRPAENYEAGGRGIYGQLDDPLPLDGAAFRKSLEAAHGG